MNKTKFFSSLLVAVLFATTSVFVSCKDYDDDIKNLQSQIDKAALKADLDALSTKLAGVESTANAAKTTAENALAKANANATEIAAVKATAEKAAADAADALKKVATAQTTAEAAQAAADGAKTLAENAQKAADAAQSTANAAQTAANAAQATANAAATKQELADAVKKVEDAAKALSDAAATKTELADAKTELKAYTDAAKDAALKTAEAAATAAEKALTDAKAYTDTEAGKINESLKSLATNAAVEQLSKDLNDEITGLKTTLAAITGEEEMAELVEIIGNFDTVVETLFSAITSIELVDSYSARGQGASLNRNYPIGLYYFHGVIAEDSKFGDNEAYTAADQQIEYKKGADILKELSFLVRVSPANADLAAADIKLLNSKGEDLEGIVELAGVERYNELITRGVTNTGLWKVSYKPVAGITEEAFNQAVRTFDSYQKPDEHILFAIAANNTTEASADRYAVSSYDIALSYDNYLPAVSFGFTVNDTYIDNIRNRWENYYDYNNQEWAYRIRSEQNQYSLNNPELAWDRSKNIPDIPATVPGALTDQNSNVVIDENVWSYETRRNEHFIYADVNEKFVIADLYGVNGYAEEYYGNRQQIDYYYVVFDKGNAIESAPSEWNAWNSYTVEGLGVMTKASDKLTMRITSESAHGDVVGFRVYAVNCDGTLADPDGRAFYVYVGKQGEENKAASANIIATKAQPDSEGMDVTGWFKAGVYYTFTPNNEKGDNKNPSWYLNADDTDDFDMSHAILKFYNKDGGLLYTINTNNYSSNWISGNNIKDAVKVVFTPKDNIAGMLNNTPYTIYIGQTEENATDMSDPLPYATLTITKVLPTTAKTLQFRPKQEGDWDNGKWVSKDGTGKFMAYMIPNEYAWNTPWAYEYPADPTATTVYDATDERDNGFKDLNNVFYNLNDNNDIEFFFANSLKKNNKIVDLMDNDKNGIYFNYPQSGDMHYILDVATEFIDGKTEHAVTTYTNYDGVSTYVVETIDGPVVHYAEDWSVKSDQSLTAIYACWHHAMYNIEFFKLDDKNKEVSDVPVLQWKAEGNTVNDYTTAKIRTKNSYNNDYFGLKLSKLVENKWLTPDLESEPQLNTKADGTGQKNPYFSVDVDDQEGGITFTQESVQVDANPTADHDEYLILTYKDAFGHKVLVSAKVQVKKAASAAPRL